MENKKFLGVEITNPTKTVNKNIKKIDIIKYYEKISPYLLPFIENRPLSVIRCHDQLQSCFFQKHPQNKPKEYITVGDKKELIYEVQLGTIEFHPYGCNLKRINKPNMMVFDLDPDENLPIKNLRQGVLHLKSILDKLKLKSFLKTSGGKGYHVVIPFTNAKSWKIFAKFSENVANLMTITWPNLYTSNIRKNQRNGKIFIDYLRNKKGSTCVAPYSLRARDNLPISLPIEWDNLNKVKPNQITIKNIDKYLNKDVWKDFFSYKQDLS